MSLGSASGHAGEFLQGAIDHSGEMCRILISIPAPGLRSNAIFTTSGRDELAVVPKWKQKSLHAFQQAWRLVSDTTPCGTLTIQSDIPVSRGMGSSTADCVASIRAAAAFWNRELTANQIAMLAHQAECFSDATMYEDRLVIFQHCDGKIHEYLDGDIPNLQLLVVEPGDGAHKVDTDLLTRPVYSEEEIGQFSECLTRFRCAAASSDLQEIASIAQISARINQKYHPKQNLDELERVAAETNALGVAVAHSGDIQVLLYPPSSLSEQALRSVSHKLEEIEMKCWGLLSTVRQQEQPQEAQKIASCG
jgi:uncharacterized protein involved in propanediol utilization